MGVIKDSFTFDDVTLVPQYSSVLPSETITVSKLSNKIINSVSGINRVVYDITSKPPSTIELE